MLIDLTKEMYSNMKCVELWKIEFEYSKVYVHFGISRIKS